MILYEESTRNWRTHVRATRSGMRPPFTTRTIGPISAGSWILAFAEAESLSGRSDDKRHQGRFHYDCIASVLVAPSRVGNLNPHIRSCRTLANVDNMDRLRPFEGLTRTQEKASDANRVIHDV